jgi:hypothetical protein
VHVAVTAFSGMCVLLRFCGDRHAEEAAMPDAALGNHMIRKMSHLRLSAAQNGHFHATPVIEVHMHCGMREFMVVVKEIGQTLRHLARIMVVDVNQSGDAVSIIASALGGFAHAGTREVANRLRPVLVTAPHDDPVEFRGELVIHSDGQTLHRLAQYDLQF